MTDRSDDIVRIAFVGDLYLGSDLNPCISPEVKAVFEDADFVVGNLEGPVSTSNAATSDKISLSSDAACITTLRNWGISCVSLANNHIFDFGEIAFERTRDILHAAGIRAFGAGANIAEARRPVTLEKKDVRIALTGYVAADTEARVAGNNVPGCAPLDLDTVLQNHDSVGADGTLHVACVHWGRCDYPLPPPHVYRLAKRLMHRRIPLVVGHHPHVVQGILEEEHASVHFSLGDFYFTDFVHKGALKQPTPENLTGCIWVVDVGKGGVCRTTVIHTKREGQTVQLNRAEARRRLFDKRCGFLVDERHESHWKKAVRSRMVRRLVHWLNPRNWKNIRREQIAGFLEMIRQMGLR